MTLCLWGARSEFRARHMTECRPAGWPASCFPPGTALAVVGKDVAPLRPVWHCVPVTVALCQEPEERVTWWGMYCVCIIV